MDRLLNVIMRGCVGLVCIYLCNLLLSYSDATCYGAINVVTFLFCALFGTPGVLLTLFVVVLRSALSL